MDLWSALRWLADTAFLQPRVLLIRQIDVVAATAPCAGAALKLWHVLRVATGNERAQTVQRGEVILTSLGSNQGPAVSLYEVNTPEIAVVLKIE